MVKPRGDLVEAARAAKAQPLPPDDLFAQSSVPFEIRRIQSEEVDGAWFAKQKAPPHEWALKAIRRDIRHTAEAMSAFTSDDVRDRMSQELRACLDVAGNLMGQAFRMAAKDNEIRLRDDLPTVVSGRDGAKGRRLQQWSKVQR